MSSEVAIISTIGFTLVSVAGFIFFLTITKDMNRKLKRDKSYDYRKHLVDMYVANKIRKKAEKENIDLDEESICYQEYLTISDCKKVKDMDDVIEEKILEEIESEQADNKKPKKDK